MKTLFHLGFHSGYKNKFPRLFIKKQELVRQYWFLGRESVSAKLGRSSAQLSYSSRPIPEEHFSDHGVAWARGTHQHRLLCCQPGFWGTGWQWPACCAGFWGALALGSVSAGLQLLCPGSCSASTGVQRDSERALLQRVWLPEPEVPEPAGAVRRECHPGVQDACGTVPHSQPSTPVLSLPQRRRGMDIKQMKDFVSQELKGLKQEHRLLSLRRNPRGGRGPRLCCKCWSSGESRDWGALGVPSRGRAGAVGVC